MRIPTDMSKETPWKTFGGISKRKIIEKLKEILEMFCNEATGELSGGLIEWTYF